MAVSSHSSHHPREILLAQFCLYVHKVGLKPHSFIPSLLCFPYFVQTRFIQIMSTVTVVGHAMWGAHFRHVSLLRDLILILLN